VDTLATTLIMSEPLACKSFGQNRSTLPTTAPGQTPADIQADARGVAARCPQARWFRGATATLPYLARRELNRYQSHRLWREEVLHARLHRQCERIGVDCAAAATSSPANVRWLVFTRFADRFVATRCERESTLVDLSHFLTWMRSDSIHVNVQGMHNDQAGQATKQAFDHAQTVQNWQSGSQR
jgi:hypothetical protein